MASIRRIGQGFRRVLGDIADKLTRGPVGLKVGFLGGTYPDGTSIPMVAVWNEYGTTRKDASGGRVQHSPPRPFMRNTIAREKAGWAPGLARAIQTNRYEAKAALNVLGQVIEGQITQTINEFDDPGNAASTIAKKGFDKALIDTSLMVKSVDYVVE